MLWRNFPLKIQEHKATSWKQPSSLEYESSSELKDNIRFTNTKYKGFQDDIPSVIIYQTKNISISVSSDYIKRPGWLISCAADKQDLADNPDKNYWIIQQIYIGILEAFGSGCFLQEKLEVLLLFCQCLKKTISLHWRYQFYGVEEWGKVHSQKIEI